MSEKMVPLKELFNEALKKQWVSEDAKTTPQRKKLAKTGFKGVTKVYCRYCKQGFLYQYKYIDHKGKRKQLSSVNFLELREKIKDKQLNWEIKDNYLARKTAKEIGLPLIDLI